jgi:hypothetical protein
MFVWKSVGLSVLLVLLSVAVVAHAPTQVAAMQLWYWHHSYLVNDHALQASKALVDKAAALGYNGVAIWDSGFNFLSNDWWPVENEERLGELMRYAKKKDMSVLATPGLFGLSNDVLEANPSWVEGIRVVGTQFQVDSTGRRLITKNSFPGLANSSFEEGKTAWFDTGDQGVGINTVAHTGKTSAVIVDAPANARLRQKIVLKPWRAYHLRLFFKSSNFRGSAALSVFDSDNRDKVRLNASLDASGRHDWTQADYMFDSQDSTEAYLYLGVWGGSSGVLWFDDVQINETALVYVVRRAGTPLRVYDPKNPTVIYREGVDVDSIADPRMSSTRTPFTDVYHDPAPVTIPPGSHLSPGQIVAIDSYSAFPIPGFNGISMCMTDAAVANWIERNARVLQRLLPLGEGILVSYDEIRQMNSCASCRAKNMTAGQLLAWSVGHSLQIYRSAMPASPLYTWSDMFDPYHNARDHYFYVEGDLTGSWKGLPPDLRILNWNLANLNKSLAWFSGTDARQPVAHRQIIAGYYDAHHGAAAAQRELSQAAGVPGVLGLMYTTWADDYSELESYAKAAKAGWSRYVASLQKSPEAVRLRPVASRN